MSSANSNEGNKKMGLATFRVHFKKGTGDEGFSEEMDAENPQKAEILVRQQYRDRGVVIHVTKTKFLKKVS